MIWTDYLNEYYFPFTIISLIIGYQISLYFFYLFYKVKDEKIRLNYFLVAMGCLYLFGVTGVILLSINSYYITDIPLSNLLRYLSHILVSIGVIIFQLIISLNDFRDIINPKISRAISVITIILSLLILLVMGTLIYIILILIAVSIGVIYMFYFHIRLIKLTSGDIRRRIIVFFIGEVILISGILLGAEKKQEIFSDQVQNIVQLLFISLFVIGLMITFFGSYRFPIFLEFKWKENVLKLYIIDYNNFKIIYTYDFTKQEEKNKYSRESLILPEDRLLFSSGIKGIKDIFTGLTHIEGGTIKRIEHGNFIILINQGEEALSFVMYCLLVKKEMKSVSYFHKVLKNEFEAFYRNILLNIEMIKGSEEKIFSGFDTIIYKIFN